MAALTYTPTVCAGTTVRGKSCTRVITSDARLCWQHVTQSPTISDSDNISGDCSDIYRPGTTKEEMGHVNRIHIQGLGHKNGIGCGVALLNAGNGLVEVISSHSISPHSAISTSKPTPMPKPAQTSKPTPKLVQKQMQAPTPEQASNLTSNTQLHAPTASSLLKPNTTTSSATGQSSINATQETLLSLLMDLSCKVSSLEAVVVRNAVQQDIHTALAKQLTLQEMRDVDESEEDN